MKKYLIILLALQLVATAFFAQKEGYKIAVEIKNTKAKYLYLGFYVGLERLQLDSALVNAAQTSIFVGNKKLQSGMYLIFDKRDSTSFNFLVDKEQFFTLKTDKDSLYLSLSAENSLDNQLFFESIKMAERARPQMAQMKSLIAELKDRNRTSALSIEQDLIKIADSVILAQEQLVSPYPQTLAYAVVHANNEFVKIPTAISDPSARYFYAKSHYFDHLDLTDSRLIRSPYLMPNIENYFNKYASFHPDSMRIATDFVLQKAIKDSLSFRFVSTKLLNFFAKPEIILYEIGYVKIVEDYLQKGKMSWIAGEDSIKFVRAAEGLKPALIGNIAPDLRMMQRDSSEISLSEVKAPYTLLIFWDPDCKVCQKTVPVLVQIYEKYQPLGLEAYSVCARRGPSFVRCWEAADADNMRWITVVDPEQKSKFMTWYNTANFPMVLVLNADKKIIAKKIKTTKLDAYLQNLFAKLK